LGRFRLLTTLLEEPVERFVIKAEIENLNFIVPNIGKLFTVNKI
jgi:hypothetical protein